MFRKWNTLSISSTWLMMVSRIMLAIIFVLNSKVVPISLPIMQIV